MKKIIYILALLFTAVSLSRCGKYLDVDPYFKDMVNVDSVFTNKNYTEQWLNDVYAYFGWYGGIEIAFADVTGFNLASDDACSVMREVCVKIIRMLSFLRRMN